MYSFGRYLVSRYVELTELYASLMIRDFGLAMISVFVPIYLYRLGFSLHTILLLYAVKYGMHTLLTIPAAFVAARFGAKHAILLSTPFLIAYLLLLYGVDQHPEFLFVAAVMFGVKNSLFFMGFHVDIVANTRKRVRGKQLGLLRILTKVMATIGPLVGGVLLMVFGFKIVFLLVSGILIVSTIPLLATKDMYSPFQVRLRTLFYKRSIKETAGLVAQGIEFGIGPVLWPLYAYLHILGSFVALGFLSSILEMTGFVANIVFGIASDINRRLTLRIGAITKICVWILRMGVQLPVHTFMLESVYSVSDTAVDISFNSMNYDEAARGNALTTLLYREFVLNASRACAFALLSFIPYFMIGFGVAATSLLLYMVY